MCGISGLYNYIDRTPVSKSLLEQFALSLHHRGPDNARSWLDKEIALAHTRLSILDLSHAADQPFFSECGRFIMSYNGEIYNFQDLKKELEGNGNNFHTSSDTEVVLASYVKNRVNAFSSWNGMFAAAIWDKEEKKLVLVRDRYGIKPLYFAGTKSGLAFGSEIKAILQDPEFPRELCWKSLVEYLHYGTSLGGNSFYKNVSQLLPGHYLEVNSQGVSDQIPYHVKEFLPSVDPFGKAVDSVRDLLEKSVTSQLISDVPVGVFLSGGIDSTAITAFAGRHYGGRISTYSAGFDFDKGVNELPNARKVAEIFGTDHHELHVKGQHLPGIIEELIDHHDKPFSDAANIPLYLLSKELNGNPKVVLQGDGGDEFFAGYHRYVRIQQRPFWKVAAPLVGMASSMFPGFGLFARAQRNVAALLENDEALLMARMMSQEPNDRDPLSLLTDEARQRSDRYSPFYRYQALMAMNKNSHLDLVGKMLWMDTQVILPDLYFEKVDRSTMAQSIEVRVPMLDNNLTNYVSSLPSSFKVHRGQGKYVLKKALEGVVPNDILYGPKTGFGVPVQHWLRTSLADFASDNILSDRFISLGLFKPDLVRKLLDDHRNSVRDNEFIIYKLLNLSLWLNRYNIVL